MPDSTDPTTDRSPGGGKRMEKDLPHVGGRAREFPDYSRRPRPGWKGNDPRRTPDDLPPAA